MMPNYQRMMAEARWQSRQARNTSMKYMAMWMAAERERRGMEALLFQNWHLQLLAQATKWESLFHRLEALMLGRQLAAA